VVMNLATTTLGHSIGAIAQAIGRPKSTVWRELSRNGLPSGRYSPLHAAGAYQLRGRREARIERDRASRTFVVDRPAEGWTPEQISGWLKGGNEPRLRAVVARRSTPSSIGQPNRPGSYGIISRAVTNAAAHADRDLRKIPSRIASPSMNGPRMSQDIVITAKLTPENAWASKPPFQAILKELSKDVNPICIALLHLAPESRVSRLPSIPARTRFGV
jgi:hypothetical protein